MSDTGVFVHDPEAYLDYSVDWSSWLAEGETITDVVWNILDDTVDGDTETEADGVATIWLTGGTVNRQAKVECKITTNIGRIDERTIRLTVRER